MSVVNVSDGETIGVLVIFVLVCLLFLGVPVAFLLILRHIFRQNKERTAAMQGYAQERGLTFEGDGRLPRATPLLRWRGRAYGTVVGTLAPGLAGKLTNFRYSTGTKQNRRTYDFATVLAPLPEAGSARFYCYQRVANDFFDPIGDALTQYQTVELESTAFGESFRLAVRDEANMLAIRQLFSPSFIVFLTEQVPHGFWFELEAAHLCGAIRGEHWERPDELDELCRATAAVANRIRSDIAERAELRGASEPPPPPPP